MKQQFVRGVSAGILVAVLAACGSSAADEGSEVASLGETTVPVTSDSIEPDDSTDEATDDTTDDTPNDAVDDSFDSASEAPVDPEEAFVAYEQCLSENGIDVSGGISDGAVVEGVGDADSSDAESQVFEVDDLEAFDECEELLGDAAGDFDLDPEQEAELFDIELAFARCMRENGIDWPDPTGTGSNVVEIEIGDEDPEVLESAMQACNSVAEESMNEVFEDAES